MSIPKENVYTPVLVVTEQTAVKAFFPGGSDELNKDKT